MTNVWSAVRNRCRRDFSSGSSMSMTVDVHIYDRLFNPTDLLRPQRLDVGFRILLPFTLHPQPDCPFLDLHLLLLPG